jgi:hypothetical protein
MVGPLLARSSVSLVNRCLNGGPRSLGSELNDRAGLKSPGRRNAILAQFGSLRGTSADGWANHVPRLRSASPDDRRHLPLVTIDPGLGFQRRMRGESTI